MKVLHVLYSGLGGHGNVFFSMTDADKEHEFQYEALFFGIEDVREEYIKKANERNIPWHFVKKKPGIDMSAYRQIVRIIKKAAPGIIFLHSSAYIFPAKYVSLFSSKKIKIIVRETQPDHLKTLAERMGQSCSLLVAKKVVFLSNEYSDTIKKKYPLIFSNKRTAVIPNGIDLDIFKPSPKPTDGQLRIGMQSRLSGSKDHATLIKAFRIVLQDHPGQNEMQLWIAGDGESRNELEALVNELGLGDKVIFTGMLEESKLSPFINSLDIYVHATQGEMMSTAIMQVMACRVPVIASDVPGVSNMIKNGETGLLVPVKDPGKMSAAIVQLLTDTAQKNMLGENGYQYAVLHFSNKRMFESYKAIFLA